VKVEFLTVDIFRLSVFFLYAIKCMLIFGIKLPIRYPFHEIWVSLRLNLRWILYESSIFFFFNIEGYREFFSGITPFRQKTRNLILMVPHSNWLWRVTTDPVWHFPHQNVTKYIKVSCYSFNMNIMQYCGKYSPCTKMYMQRVLKYNFILIYDFTIIETGRFNVIL
jgi:hypothetical protein